MAVSAHGTQMQMDDGTGAFTTIAEVLDISGPGLLAVTDVLRPDGGGHPVVVPAGVEPGEMTFDVNYTGHATQARMRDAVATQALSAFRVVFPTDPTETLAFTAYVTGFSYTAPVEGVLRASVTVTLASALTTVEA